MNVYVGQDWHTHCSDTLLHYLYCFEALGWHPDSHRALSRVFLLRSYPANFRSLQNTMSIRVNLIRKHEWNSEFIEVYPSHSGDYVIITSLLHHCCSAVLRCYPNRCTVLQHVSPLHSRLVIHGYINIALGCCHDILCHCCSAILRWHPNRHTVL